jgi:hypothetical protein
MEKFVYPNLGGGANLGSDPTDIRNDEMRSLINFYPYHTRLRRRGGVRRLTSAAGDTITAMFPYKLSTGSWLLVAGHPSKFSKLDAGALVDIPLEASLSIAASNNPWIFFQYKDYLYGLREGKFVRINDTVVRSAGIEAMAAAPNLSDIGAGALVAGTYRGVMTGVNLETDMESNPSPVSNALTIASGRQISWNSLGFHPNPFVNARRLYRTLENQQDVYFFVAQINDNDTTVDYLDEVVVADLGRTVSFSNGLPPAGIKLGVIWQERLMATDGRDLFYSEFLLPEQFGSEIIPISTDDGHVIRALHAFGDRLIIGKTNKVYYLIGNTRATFGLHVLDDVHGIMSHYSVQSAEGSLFWYGSGKAVYRSDGTSVRNISTPKIATILERVPDVYEEKVVAAVFPQLSWYVLSVPYQGEGEALNESNRKVLVYNYKFDVWTVFEHPSDAPQFISNFFNENYGHVLYATFYDGHVYHYNDESYGTDWENAITAEFETKFDDFSMPGLRKAMDQAWLLTPRVEGGEIRLRVVGDDEEVLEDRTVSLDIEGMDYKPFKLPTWGTPSTRLSLKGTYTGEEQITIDALAFIIGTLRRGPGRPR